MTYSCKHKPIIKDKNPLVACSNVSYSISGRVILTNVNAQINRGEILTIVGPNGGGKTTLAKILIGIISGHDGSVKRTPGLTVGYTPQKMELNQLIPISVRDFLFLNARSEDLDRTHALIQSQGIERILNHQLYDLSGGELQRVMLARALMKDPDLLVLDEPTQALDVNGQIEFYKFLERTKKRGDKTVVIISHDLHTVMRTTDRVICLDKTVMCSGVPEHIERSGVYNKLFFVVGGENTAYYTHEHKHKKKK